MFHDCLFGFYAIFSPEKSFWDSAGRVDSALQPTPIPSLMDPLHRPLGICQVVTEVHFQLETESLRVVTTCLGCTDFQ